MNRRHFIKGFLLGSGATLGSLVGIKATQGDYRPLVDPLGVMMDPLPEFQAVMKVILLGTGTPLPNPYRSKPALVVLAGKKVSLVDCGAGTIERLLQARICPERIEDVFITHHHSDHNSGLVDFFITGWGGTTLPGRSKPLNLYGPGNTQKIISNLMDHLAWDIHLRTLQAHNPPNGA
ncbi:MAG: MBL fold metallo-hydrolase [Deltaproteobacteria bacterium]|nr:MBL fold metallo-hydrolase [Deltaproteobacteria bacterium]